MIPSVSTHSAWSHRDYLYEEKDPGRAQRVHKREEKLFHLRELSTPRCRQQRPSAWEQSKVGRWARGKRKAEPFDPLTKVVREGDDGIQAAVRDGIVRLRHRPSVLDGLFLGLALGDGLAAEAEQDLVVVHVSREARRPERDSGPEAWGRRCRRAGEVRGGGGGGEEGGEEEAVRRVERDRGGDDDEVRFGAGGGAEGGDERAVEVVCEVERGEDQRGADAECGAGEGREGEGGGGKGVEVRCDEEGEGGDELHHDPGLDAIDGENAVGRGEPAERRIVHKGSGAEQSKTVKEPLFGHCQFVRMV